MHLPINSCLGEEHSHDIKIAGKMSTIPLVPKLKTAEKSTQKKKEILPFVITWMNRERIMLSIIIQREKNKYCMIAWLSLIHRIKKKKRKQKS